ncbi:hypothetical protein NEDG_02148 [Nematocida displodere]|uniref:Integrase catalytic domain-containing protein n=1 Tax=Nematocida displodere TaxID=1805483 RepID=A0A177EFM8_9MICR|nr:hypothetical protein NEDG_02148 [Nematocida displodere]
MTEKEHTFRIHINATLTKQLLEEIKTYHITEAMPTHLVHGNRFRFKKQAERFYIAKDYLFYNTEEGNPLLVVGSDDYEKINEILRHFHGKVHASSIHMFQSLQMEFFGFTQRSVNAWVRMCPECTGLARPSTIMRYQEVVKVVREPWFAVAVFGLSLSEVDKTRNEIAIFIQDIYSTYTLCEVVPWVEPDTLANFLDRAIQTFGIPEIVKLIDGSLRTDAFLRFCEEKEIQVVEPHINPELFTQEILTKPEFQMRYLFFEIKKEPNIDKAIELMVRNHNFTDLRRGTDKIQRVPADVFFRRPTRMKSKKRSYVYWKTYKITRADLPSLIDLLPEDVQEAIPASASESPPECSILPDKEIEAEMRPEPDKVADALLYDPANPEYKLTELESPQAAYLEGYSKQNGILVKVARESSFVRKYPSRTREAEMEEFLEDDTIEPPKKKPKPTSDLYIRGISPEALEFEPHPYWILGPVPNTDRYLLYNTETKETSEIHKIRIFQLEPEERAKKRHLTNYLIRKFKNYHPYKVDCDLSFGK